MDEKSFLKVIREYATQYNIPYKELKKKYMQETKKKPDKPTEKKTRKKRQTMRKKKEVDMDHNVIEDTKTYNNLLDKIKIDGKEYYACIVNGKLVDGSYVYKCIEGSYPIGIAHKNKIHLF